MNGAFALSFAVWAGVFGAVAASALLVFFLADFVLYLSTLSASQKLHDGSFQNLLHGTMQFFDSTPIGRILNRFSKDIDRSVVRTFCLFSNNLWFKAWITKCRLRLNSFAFICCSQCLCLWRSELFLH